MVQYQIPSSSEITLSTLFNTMEEVTGELSIEDYSISQTSLENVSLSLFLTPVITFIITLILGLFLVDLQGCFRKYFLN